ncbi:MAG: hypothetical protein AAF696_36790, partial [Bacteroidota bacterium]
MRNILWLTFLLLSLNLSAQDWERRHAFAKSYFGLSSYFVPSLERGSFLDVDANVRSFDRSGFLSPAINIGATHFWGYADFYVSINTADLKFKKDQLKNRSSFGTFTGLRIYPWNLQNRKIRPFLGYKFSPFRYRQEDISGNSFKYTQVKSVF